MIHTKIGFQMNAVYSNINKAIDIGALNGAKKEAEEFQKDAKTNLSQAVSASGGKESGKLSGAIGVKNAGIMLPGLVRYDVVVDTNKAPHAWWIELGAQTPIGLPYSKTGKKNYSKSTFRGHKYLEKTLIQHIESGKPTEIVGTEVFKSLLTLT